jgi:hypothetical protein
MAYPSGPPEPGRPRAGSAAERAASRFRPEIELNPEPLEGRYLRGVDAVETETRVAARH